ncbi:MAG: hypothetical protein JSR46_08015, partial [Verrucomicrobia bacterium]|nr:hypothetical protein [Verrucomicrobiota bacterium]
MGKGVLCTGLSAIEAYNNYERQKSAAQVPGTTPISKKRLVVVNIGNAKEVQLWDLKQVSLFERFKAAIGWKGSSFDLKDVAITVSTMTQEIKQEDAKVYKKFVDNLNFYNGHKILPGFLHYFQSLVPDTVIKAIDDKAEEAFAKKNYSIGVQFISFISNHLQSLDELSEVEFSTELLGYLKGELEDVTRQITNKEQEILALVVDYPEHGNDAQTLLNLTGGERKKIAELREKWEKKAIPEKPAVDLTVDTAKQLEELANSIVEESIPFLRGWLSTLQDDIDKDDISVELLNTYEDSVDAAEAMLERSLSQITTFSETIDRAKSELGALKSEIDRLREEIAEKQRPIGSSEPVHVPGIENAGNSCYMNSALQGLLVSPLIVQKIKEYNKEPVPEDERFMPTLKEFLSAYERYSEKPSSEDSSAIAKLASTLQTQLYEARLQYLGVEHLHAKAEADLVVSTLGQVLGVEYSFITRTQGFCGQ